MKFVSTRGGMAPANFMDILLDGLAPDGGLVVPETTPRLNTDELAALRDLSYAELAARIIGLFATDIPREDLERITETAYGTDRFPENTVPVTYLHDEFFLVGLSAGPTMAFKDLAMQFLGQAIPYVLEKTGRTLNIVGATSGDTGSSAEHAFKGAPGVSVYMLSPKGRMSAVQRAQMYSITDSNIHNLVVDGVFDDCQDIVKAVNNDADFKRTHHIGAVNSINFGRIAAQVVYYFWAWLRYTDIVDEDYTTENAGHREIAVCVPSGNFGNIYAGHLARRMGVPIARLMLATNENNVLDEFFTTGHYTPRSRENTYATSSPSMDISKASNLERFVYDLVGAKEFPEAWAQLDAQGTVDLESYVARLGAEFGFASAKSVHQDRLDSIRATFEETGVVIDPHTADGVTVAKRLSDGTLPVLIMETAKPDKFRETVVEALGQDAPDTSDVVKDMLKREQFTVDMPNSADAIKAYIEEEDR